MDEMQAALLHVKLPHLDGWTALRRRAAGHYDRLLDAIGVAHAAPASGGDHAYHVYAVRVADRDAVRARLAPAVGTNIHYPIPVHLQPAYADLGYRAGDFPVAEKLAAETLSLPMFPGLTAIQVVTVCGALAEARAPAAAPAQEVA
jgi:dTDP-4-amino-4,6-dideoxygalactose transaminase